MKRYRVELWEADGEPNRMPDATMIVTASDGLRRRRGGHALQARARAILAAQYRAERAAGSRGRFNGERGIWIEWADSYVVEEPCER